MKGWFDAFRTDGGPTLYSYSNRTPVTGDVPTITLYLLFFTLFIAFILIFPGVRKERFTTFTSVTLSLFVGSAILVSKYGSAWHVADTSIMSYYRAFSKEKLSADLGVHIGLMHFNVTLQGLSSNTSYGEDIDFNEQFKWERASEIQEEFRSALVKGLPYPILTVLEYFSMDDEGFCWGRSYRLAGYYAGIFLWASFASWLLMNLLLVVVPRYGAYQMVITGVLMLTTNFLYYLLIPPKPLLIRFEDNFLVFKFGWSYWFVLIAGGACGTVGSFIAIMDLLFPHKFSTILEVDYDTPYDRHIIIEESHDTGKKKGKRSLEDPQSIGIGKKILRTLSMRGGKDDGEDMRLSHQMGGHTNQAFDMQLEAPNSPWRYPHYMYPKDNSSQLRGALANAFVKNPALVRLAAPNPTKSPKSVSFRRQSRLETTYAMEGVGGRTRRSDSNDSTTTSSSSEFHPPPLHHTSNNLLHHHSELPTSFQSHLKSIKRTNSSSSNLKSIKRTESGSSMSNLSFKNNREMRRYLSTSNLSRPPKKHIHKKLISHVSSCPLSPTLQPHFNLDPNLMRQLDTQLRSSNPKLIGVSVSEESSGGVVFDNFKLPRASIGSRSSSEEEGGGSRRGSGNSTSTRSSSGFSSNSYEDPRASQPDSRRSSKENEW